MNIIKSNSRGYYDHGWLKSYHSFSFADYYNESRMNFHNLRVLNDDIVASNSGFPLHPHSNMEIITYVLSGSLTHSDSLENKEEIKEGNFQYMSAGEKIIHSEFNHGKIPCHLLQIWITPNIQYTKPEYKIFDCPHIDNWALIVDDGTNGAVQIKQNVKLFVINSKVGKILLPKINSTEQYLHLASGDINFDNQNFISGDAVSGSLLQHNYIEINQQSKILLFAFN